jgi:hypothetical protein
MRNKEKIEKKQIPNNWENMPDWLWVILVILIGGGLLWLFNKSKHVYARKPTFTKKNLRKHYCVDGKTFNKWILHFCVNDTFQYEEYLRKRKLSEDFCLHIVAYLGIPSDETPVLNKKQIADPYDNLDGDVYRSLRRSIIKQGIIPTEIYDDLRVFPPKIAQLLRSNF